MSEGVALPDFNKEVLHQLIHNDWMITAPCVQKVAHSCTQSGAYKLLVTQANTVQLKPYRHMNLVENTTPAINLAFVMQIILAFFTTCL